MTLKEIRKKNLWIKCENEEEVLSLCKILDEKKFNHYWEVGAKWEKYAEEFKEYRFINLKEGFFKDVPANRKFIKYASINFENTHLNLEVILKKSKLSEDKTMLILPEGNKYSLINNILVCTK